MVEAGEARAEAVGRHVAFRRLNFCQKFYDEWTPDGNDRPQQDAISDKAYLPDAYHAIQTNREDMRRQPTSVRGIPTNYRDTSYCLRETSYR